MKKLRTAVVGVGHLGRHHARIMAGMDDVELVAVVDATPEARRSVAEQYGAEPLDDYRKLVGRVDAVVLATPTVTHHAIAGELLAAGVHLLVEKPLTPSSRAADELIAAARQRGLVLQVGHVERFNPAWEHAAELIEQPKFIETRRLSGYSFRSTDIGVVLDVMIHDIDLVLSVVDSPIERVEAVGASVLGDHEDVASVRLGFANGCVAALTASRVSYEMCRQTQVWTPERFVGVDFATREVVSCQPVASVAERQFQVANVAPDARLHLRDHLFAELLPVTRTTIEARDQLTAELTDFVASVRTSRQPRVTGTAARDAIAVAERILAEIAAHQWTGTKGGPQGPLVAPADLTPPPVVPFTDDERPWERRRAG
ncbi:MAG: Gfo/Idh/MocA family oxidoreductase [Pirellulales bacterium]